MMSLWAHGSLPVLFFDAECPMCTRTAWFIDRRDRRRTLRFVALKSDEGRSLVAAHPRLAAVDSLVWLESDMERGGTRSLAYSAAVLAVGRYLGGVWAALATAGWWIPLPLRDAVYRVIAAHRTHSGPGGRD